MLEFLVLFVDLYKFVFELFRVVRKKKKDFFYERRKIGGFFLGGRGGGVWIGIYMYFILYDFDDFVIDDFFYF